MLRALKWILLGLSGLVILTGMVACTPLGLNYASLDYQTKPKAIPELGPDFDAAAARRTLEQALYGPWPAGLAVSATAPRLIEPDFLSGRGTLEEVLITIGEGDGRRTFPLVLAMPRSASVRPVPLLLSQTFVDNCAVFPDHAVSRANGQPCEGSSLTGLVGLLARQIFGRYIAEAPLERYVDAGLAYASFSGASFIPDQDGAAQSALAALSSDPLPTSALMAWAFAYHAAAELLTTDPRIESASVTALGHSRYGKSALIAAAWSDQIDAAIAHQSGFGGAASGRSKTGETLVRMARAYPHWVRPRLAADLEAGRGPVADQHMLLAAAAPKPLFLGNARRDVWSDPNSTYRMAVAADRTYEAAGRPGLVGDGLRDFHPDADISFWLRAGGHSVTPEDIDAFLLFLRAHFLSKQGSPEREFP